MMKASRWSGWRSSERGFLTLIALLVVIVIIGILFASQYGGRTRRSAQTGGRVPAGESQTLLGGAVDRADATLCLNNVKQLRMAISIYQGNMGTFPGSLAELQSGVTLACPVGEEPYEYDPNTGVVRCVHPGHERY